MEWPGHLTGRCQTLKSLCVRYKPSARHPISDTNVPKKLQTINTSQSGADDISNLVALS